MTTQTLAEMTRLEFQTMLETVVERTVERKLLEILGDPDEGLTLLESVQDRLIQQKRAVADETRSIALEDALQQLELAC